MENLEKLGEVAETVKGAQLVLEDMATQITDARIWLVITALEACAQSLYEMDDD